MIESERIVPAFIYVLAAVLIITCYLKNTMQLKCLIANINAEAAK